MCNLQSVAWITKPECWCHLVWPNDTRVQFSVFTHGHKCSLVTNVGHQTPYINISHLSRYPDLLRHTKHTSQWCYCTQTQWLMLGEYQYGILITWQYRVRASCKKCDKKIYRDSVFRKAAALDCRVFISLMISILSLKSLTNWLIKNCLLKMPIWVQLLTNWCNYKWCLCYNFCLTIILLNFNW